jgi:hypothetical protein
MTRLSRILSQIAPELLIIHGPLAAVACWTGRHNILFRVATTTNGGQLMLALQLRRLISAVCAAVVIFRQKLLPLLNSQCCRQSHHPRTACALVIVIAAGIGSAIARLISKKIGLIGNIVRLMIGALPFLALACLISRSVQSTNMIRVCGPAAALLFGMFRKMIFLIHLGIASKAAAFRIVRLAFLTITASDYILHIRCAVLRTITGSTKALASIPRLSAAFFAYNYATTLRHIKSSLYTVQVYHIRARITI